MTASAAPPPFDGPHWKPVAKVIETFRARWGILAADKFNAQKWWYRWSTASGFPRRLVHTVYPPETSIEFDSDILDVDHEDEIEIRLNGEPCYGWLAVWDPPAAAVSSSPPASPTQSESAAASSPPPRERANRKTGKPGPKEYDMWPDLFRHLDSVVAVKGKFESFAAAAREGVRWLEKDPARRPQADPDTVRAKIRETRPDLVGELIGPE